MDLKVSTLKPSIGPRGRDLVTSGSLVQTAASFIALASDVSSAVILA